MPASPDHLDGDAHDDFGGLHRDLPSVLPRRQAMRWLGGASLAAVLAACTSNAPTSNPASTSSGATPTDPDSARTEAGPAAAGEEIPAETAGPFPADGSNGPNLLSEDGVVRADITSSIGDLSGTAEGVPLTIRLTVVEADTGAPLPGAAVYLWHCTADGRYSIYEIPDQNYLRGVATADEAGRVTFETVFPGCYPGRWPHAHFEVYGDVASATTGSQADITSQLALPQADCETVYADSRYGDSTSHLSRLSLATDGVFRDGWDQQLATVSGSMADGFTASLLVRV